ncbi:MAG: hypothetical protein HC848_08655 [Limnobacter sp.]|nr:hypothetical protein [Limnobacter sp.]
MNVSSVSNQPAAPGAVSQHADSSQQRTHLTSNACATIAAALTAAILVPVAVGNMFNEGVNRENVAWFAAGTLGSEALWLVVKHSMDFFEAKPPQQTVDQGNTLPRTNLPV